MKKYYLFFVLFTTLGISVNASEVPSETLELAAEYEEMTAEVYAPELPDVDSELTAISISVQGSQVHVTNASGQTLEIYNLAGVRVATYKIESDDKTVYINLPKGCYILKVDKLVRKVSLK